MPAIRYRHNYKATILIDKVPNVWTPTITGNRIPARLKNGGLKYLPFAGFIQQCEVSQMQRVKIIGIEAFTFDDDGLCQWQDIFAQAILGVHTQGHYLVVLNEAGPIQIHDPI